MDLASCIVAAVSEWFFIKKFFEMCRREEVDLKEAISISIYPWRYLIKRSTWRRCQFPVSYIVMTI